MRRLVAREDLEVREDVEGADGFGVAFGEFIGRSEGVRIRIRGSVGEEEEFEEVACEVWGGGAAGGGDGDAFVA